MPKKIILIEGYLASGKSAFALRLSRQIGVPYLMKDTFKSALCEKASIPDRAARSLFSSITFDAMMYVTERMFESGYPIILEGNFVPAGVKSTDEAGTIRQLIKAYRYTPLTFKFAGDTRVLYERFVEREKTPERGRANQIGHDISYETFDGWCHGLDSFDAGGEIVKVDTTDFSKVDFEYCIELARRFMG